MLILTSDIQHHTSYIRHLLFHAAKEQLNISAYLKPYFFRQKIYVIQISQVFFNHRLHRF